MTTEPNAKNIITQIEAKGAAVILGGVDSGFIVGNYSSDSKKLAQELKTSFVPDLLGGIINQKDLMYDSIHPNSKGYAVMANRFIYPLSKLLK